MEEFKVKDRRRFTPEGEPKETEEKEETLKKDSPPPNTKREPSPLPPVDFASFILSLAASTQVHLGLIPMPNGRKEEKNIPLAKQTIDVLGVLEEKTKGNLTEDEEKILKEILYSLRLQYVEAQKQ